MPDTDPRLVGLDRAVQILVNADQEIAYRDLISKLSLDLPNFSRADLSNLITELVVDRAEQVWRPRPGFFAIRTANNPVARRVGHTIPRNNSTVERKWPERPLPNRIENLRRVGFQNVGEWLMKEGAAVAEYQSSDDLSEALIAYVVGDSVMYISRSINVKQGVTNRLARAIRSALSTQRSVHIYALTRWDAVEHQGIRVNVAAGLEEELIERMQPPWNRSSRL
jgi:hypothetical protein